MITLVHCKLADKDHKEYSRQYAHTFHKGDKTICVAKAYFKLPEEYKIGLLAHEIGHLLVGEGEKREYKADEAANKFFKIKIRYKDSAYGEYLQYLTEKDIEKVLLVLDRLRDYATTR